MVGYGDTKREYTITNLVTLEYSLRFPNVMRYLKERSSQNLFELH